MINNSTIPQSHPTKIDILDSINIYNMKNVKHSNLEILHVNCDHIFTILRLISLKFIKGLKSYMEVFWYRQSKSIETPNLHSKHLINGKYVNLNIILQGFL